MIDTGPALEILYRDEHYIAVNKPSGMLVHRTELAEQQGVFAMMKLRDQIGQHVFTCHRLDRPTSGVLIFGLSAEAGHKLQMKFADKTIFKKYLAVVRGYTSDEAIRLDKPVKSRYESEAKDAVTSFKTIAKVELPIPVGPYETARYSLVEAYPETGRTHQIRIHLKSLNHPIVGDTRYGDGRHNKMIQDKFGNNRLLLHAEELSFEHPFTGELVKLHADMPSEMNKVLEEIGLVSPTVPIE
ncbi:RluA family pseudouridine synthase [Limibacter armeniacum]|uniref:RluA family pseudouridine synthase n=1 Tax=Limibacter armeniacum TaxID=466084 RepID=UPI002FE51B23